MADYKDIITGTLGSLVEKVKDVANSGAVRGMYEQGASRAKAYGRITKLTLEINGQHEELKRVYTEIGRLCYEQNREDPKGLFVPLFQQVRELNGEIAAKEAEIASLKADMAAGDESGIEVEVEIQKDGEPEDGFEQVVSATEDEAAPGGETQE